ncbi:uncharacterized protein LOC126824872 [Patella vulgata]|uniref:uncharacterized protein LOC126824872 n=1 Tax=Patella vulgata TaxID=6465 RepID=UPI0024A9B32B|nr:uncharacterized protein LOC126824872 [Patella vulgata]
MSSNEIVAALKLLSSSSEKHIFNGMVAIRTKIMKSKNGEKQLISKGVIGKLLSILNKQDVTQKKNKIIDIALSILGNFCMEEEARADVLKVPYGINCICNCVIESPCSSIQNRAARTLANLALTPLIVVRIFQTDVLPQLVKLLIESKNKESQLIYCRALRLLGASNTGKEKLLDENGVFAVAKLMSSEDEDVMRNSLRTVSELSVSGCSYKFARQILAAGIINIMVDQIHHKDCSISHQALSTVIRLTEFEYIRPVIGSAGGITLFITLLTDTRQHVDKIKVMNVLCLCGKESVNRVKIRENGALEILLSALNGVEYQRLHDRIISSFLSYLYDEPSLNLLLENGLIDILLRHLERCTEFTSSTIVISFSEKFLALEDSDKDTVNTSAKLQHIKARPKQIPKRCKSKDVRKNMDKIVDDLPSSSTSMDDSKPSTSRVKHTSGGLSLIAESPASTDLNIPRTSSIEITPTKKSSHIYSIDSPTYENHSWEPSSLSGGITCKQSFSSGAGTSGGQSPYSPLSHDSYYSPGVSSPSYSIPSPASPDLPYSTVWSQPYRSDSHEDLSPFSSSSVLGGADVGTPASAWTFSSSDDEDINNVDDSSNINNADITDRTSPVTDQIHDNINMSADIKDKIETMIESDESDEMSTVSDACSNLSLTENKSTVAEHPKALTTDNKDMTSERSLKHKRTPSEENSETEVQPKRQKRSAKRHAASKITESNILILLSRFSVINDPSQYLVTPRVLSCILDYIREVPGAQSRSVRTMSRILRDPLCLNSLLNIGAPAIIYQKLVLNNEGVDCSDVRSLVSKSKRRSSLESTSSWLSPFSSPRQSISDFSPDPSGKKWNFPTDPGSPTSSTASLDYSVASPHFKKEEKEEPPIDVTQTGVEFLRDLSFTAESPFGQGAITHTLLRKTKAERLACCLSLQFLCWSSSMQDHFLVKHFTLDSLLNVIQSNVNHAMLPHIVNGLNFLAHMSNMKRKLKKEDNVSFPVVFLPPVLDEQTCPYWNCNHDVFFMVGNEQFGGNREILVKQSPVFAAMLEGHYCESNQSEISMQDTSQDAFLFILHYFHGCGLCCPILAAPHKETKNLEFWENVLTLADRYLCQLLSEYLIWLIASTYLTFDIYFHIFMYSIFHNFTSLTNECVRMMFSAEQPVVLKAGIVKNIIKNNGAGLLCNSIKSVFRECIGKNFT